MGQVAIATQLGISQSSVQKHLKRINNGASYYEKVHRRGRPRVMTEHDRIFIKRKFYGKISRNAADLQRTFFPHVDPRTVRRFCVESGLHGRRVRQVPLLSRTQIKMRNAFAKALLSWNDEQWNRVIFSDESKFHLFGSDGVQYCRRMNGDAMNPIFTQKMVKHGGGRVMVWGCITSQGVGRLHRVDGNMDRFQYVRILKESLLGTLKDNHIHRKGFVFQQDNDPKHTSAYAKEFFQKKGLIVLPWPSNSPDLNPIEHVWNYLDNRVHSRTCGKPRNEDHLWEILQEEWQRIEPHYIQKLFRSMWNRLDAVISAKGGNTEY